MESIKDTVFKFLRLDNLVDNLSGFVEARIDLLKIEIREDVAKVLAQGLVVAAVLLLALMFLLFFSIGLANYLNTFFVEAYAGYWIVAGIYGIPCILFLLFKNKISNYFERQMMEIIKRKGK
jgi:uncharacterized membrane protein YqjE